MPFIDVGFLGRSDFSDGSSDRLAHAASSSSPIHARDDLSGHVRYSGHAHSFVSMKIEVL